MYDAVLHYRDQAREQIHLDTWGLKDQGYVLCTVHRQENTDDPVQISAILSALHQIARELPEVMPLHPRTRDRFLQQHQLTALVGLTHP